MLHRNRWYKMTDNQRNMGMCLTCGGVIDWPEPEKRTAADDEHTIIEDDWPNPVEGLMLGRAPVPHERESDGR